MAWLDSLFFGQGIAHSVLVFAIVIAIGIVLGKVKIKGISLGITWILFVGIICSHFGMRVDEQTLHFVKEFGLILFVYSVGMQVGPGFFSSFKKGGLTLNVLASMIVFLGVITAYVIHLITGLPITTMVGILSGAVTNTPGLGAAQQAYTDMTGIGDPTIPLGYAIAYPLGVIGIIGSILLIRVIFRIKFEREHEVLEKQDEDKATSAQQFSVKVTNPALFGKDVMEVTRLINRKFVFSRVCHGDDRIEIGSSDTRLKAGDKLLVVAASKDIEAITAFLGEQVDVAWEQLDKQLVSRRVVITKSDINGKLLGEMKLRNCFGVNVTRVNRAGFDLVAKPNLQLQMGDRLTVVGPEAAVNNVAKVLGNSLRRLREPNLVPIFLGIFLGVFLGSIPFTFPGIPQPVKLGLAGGPLIVSILISRFGPHYKLVTYATMSANLMLREVGISLFLAGVGLGAGEGFVETVIDGGGLNWIGYGVVITVLPLLIVGIIARLFYKINYFTLMGLIAGSTTDPPALAYSNGVVGNDMPSVSYATVYPLTMFLRVLTAQLLILFVA
ncbi:MULTISPECIES: putative transporter [Sanguibacteroides]|uniref:Transporter n=1 Tax=Sanguibacteroides justesenii TaxID=1547597 RepID=A0A0C3RH24_9PORP|nr:MULTISPECIES: putative transporter [Sanguibacteroides]KIO44914.1 transporter [Sanguibacteroides justesenii]PXZ43135.1 putative transporter [Sanguibacteroides justesenii]